MADRADIVRKTRDRLLAALDLIGLDESIEVHFEIVDKFAGPSTTEDVVTKSVKIFKTHEERYVLGIVLEPTLEMNKPDSQDDVYSAEEVRLASYGFMENFQITGIQHKKKAGDKIKILESWIQRDDATIEGQLVKAGTWMLGVRIVDDDLWAAVKDGSFTGFSIGGMANRQPLVTD